MQAFLDHTNSWVDRTPDTSHATDPACRDLYHLAYHVVDQFSWTRNNKSENDTHEYAGDPTNSPKKELLLWKKAKTSFELFNPTKTRNRITPNIFSLHMNDSIVFGMKFASFVKTCYTW